MNGLELAFYVFIAVVVAWLVIRLMPIAFVLAVMLLAFVVLSVGSFVAAVAGYFGFTKGGNLR